MYANRVFGGDVPREEVIPRHALRLIGGICKRVLKKTFAETKKNNLILRGLQTKLFVRMLKKKLAEDYKGQFWAILGNIFFGKKNIL